MQRQGKGKNASVCKALEACRLCGLFFRLGLTEQRQRTLACLTIHSPRERCDGSACRREPYLRQAAWKDWPHASTSNP
jgi:hypothetical protein